MLDLLGIVGCEMSLMGVGGKGGGGGGGGGWWWWHTYGNSFEITYIQCPGDTAKKSKGKSCQKPNLAIRRVPWKDSN